MKSLLIALVVLVLAACAVPAKRVYVVEGHRYHRPVVVHYKAPPRHLDCWRVGRRWHCWR